MKKKLTVTVDPEVLLQAKLYARSQGVSLSSIVNLSLRDVTGEETPTFAAQWRGRFRPAHRDDPRYDSLSRKYL